MARLRVGVGVRVRVRVWVKVRVGVRAGAGAGVREVPPRSTPAGPLLGLAAARAACWPAP